MSNASQKQTKASRVLENLRLDIANGVFAPNEKLQMDDLKERYGVGYSPVREALSRLVSKGLVQLKEQCGFSVAPLSLEELYDLYAIRDHIETLALELSIQNGDEHWEADILSTWHRYEKYLNLKTNKNFDPDKWDVLQREFLFTLVKACGSQWLLKIRDLLYDQADRYRCICLDTNYENKRFLREFIQENQSLVTAVLSRNVQKAIKISKEGWDTSVKMIAQALKEKQLI